MGSLSEEIAATRQKLESLGVETEKAVRQIQNEATTRVLGVVRDAEMAKTTLALRLAHLQAAAGDEGAAAPEPAAAKPAAPKGSAGDLILAALAARGPLPSSRVDAAVIGAGLTKAAADKAKQTLKKNGLVTSEKRIWKITEAGMKRASG